jgi:hypothetical protein
VGHLCVFFSRHLFVSWIALLGPLPGPLIVRMPCLWLIYLEISCLVALQQEKSPSPRGSRVQTKARGRSCRRDEAALRYSNRFAPGVTKANPFSHAIKPKSRPTRPHSHPVARVHSIISHSRDKDGRTSSMSGPLRTVTSLKRWSCSDRQLPLIHTIKAIHVYDFDNTRKST